MDKSFYKLFLFIVCIFSLTACSKSPDKIANEAMKEIGNGKYYDATGLGLNTTQMFILDKNSIFSDAEVESIKARNYENSSIRENIIRTDILFSNYELSSKRESKINLYSLVKKSGLKGLDDPDGTYKALKKGLSSKNGLTIDFDPETHKEIGFHYIDHENVPIYIYRYRVKGNHLAELHVIDLPDKGNKVTYFQFIK